MGSNCSCIHGGNIDEKQLIQDNLGQAIESNVLPAVFSSNRALQEANNSYLDLKVELSDLILLQSCIRGFIDRKQIKNLNSFKFSSELASRSVSTSSLPQAHRRSIQELPPNKIPDYSNTSTLKVMAKLGPFKCSASQKPNLVKRGAVLMENQAIYTGEWNNENQREGQGTQHWSDGSVYEGEWLVDKANGKGRLIHANGDVYEGEWENDRANGFGVYIHNYGVKVRGAAEEACISGARYEGSWKNDKQHGNGTETWPDGAKYTGKYENGLKHGEGKFEWAEGSWYEGNFYQNNIHGIGTYYWSDGRKYLGQWKDNKMHGRGVFTWADGRRYEGEYLDDKKHGFGIFTWQDGRKYEGTWKEGKQDGKGLYTSTNGVTKEGTWQSGKKIQTLIS